MRVLVVDNYDSFTFNIVYYLKELGARVKVVKNDFAPLKTALDYTSGFDALVISPGYGTPNDAGLSLKLIAELAPKIKILGVCLGLQCIAQVFGGEVVQMNSPQHAKSVKCELVEENELFCGIKKPFEVALYNSLYARNIGTCKLLAYSKLAGQKIPMAIKHEKYDCYGLQFHPESILMNQGKKILHNFLKL